jgi:hypothetical protein
MTDDTTLVRIELEPDTTVYFSASPLDGAAADGGEQDIAVAPARLEDVLSGVRLFARQLNEVLRESGAKKATVEFGCEVGVEAGGALVAVLGKASAKSSLKVCLEWVN